MNHPGIPAIIEIFPLRCPAQKNAFRVVRYPLAEIDWILVVQFLQRSGASHNLSSEIVAQTFPDRSWEKRTSPFDRVDVNGSGIAASPFSVMGLRCDAQV